MYNVYQETQYSEAFEGKFPQSNLLGKALFRIPPIPIAFQGGIGNRKRLHEIDAGTRYC